MADATLQFTPGDATWQRLRTKALTDLYWFAGVVLGYGDKVGMVEHVHRLLCRFAERRTGIPELDQAHFLKIEMPRLSGKSSLVTQARAIQRICQNPNIAILICNEKLGTAAGFLAEIKYHFEKNAFFRALFPEIIPADVNHTKWSEDEIIVERTQSRKEATITALGVGGTATGDHYDLIIVDDMLSREAAENARVGGELTNKTNRWIAQLRPLLNPWADPFPEICFIGTRWHHGDSYEWLETAFGAGEEKASWLLGLQLPTGEKQQLTVYRVGEIAVFRRSAIENGRSFWPENPEFSLENLARLRMMDPELFAANMLNSPSDQVTATFKESWLKTYSWLDPKTVHLVDGQGAKKSYAIRDLDVLILVDPGGFKERIQSSRSVAAVVTTGSTPDGAQLILDVYSEPVTFVQVIDIILDRYRRYGARKVYVEIAAQQRAFLELLRRVARERGQSLVWEEISPQGQHKDARILGLEGYFQRGHLYLGQGPAFLEFRQQLAQFPRGRRKDLLDALAYGPRVWRSVSNEPQRMTTPQRQAWEREQLRRRMGWIPASTR